MNKNKNNAMTSIETASQKLIEMYKHSIILNNKLKSVIKILESENDKSNPLSNELIDKIKNDLEIIENTISKLNDYL